MVMSLLEAGLSCSHENGGTSLPPEDWQLYSWHSLPSSLANTHFRLSFSSLEQEILQKSTNFGLKSAINSKMVAVAGQDPCDDIYYQQISKIYQWKKNST